MRYPLSVVSSCSCPSAIRCVAQLAPNFQSHTLATTKHKRHSKHLKGSSCVRESPTCRMILVMRGDVVQVHAGGVRGAGPPGTMGGGRSGTADAAGSHRLGHIRISPGHQHCRLLQPCRCIARLPPADGAHPTISFVAQYLTPCLVCDCRGPLKVNSCAARVFRCMVRLVLSCAKHCFKMHAEMRHDVVFKCISRAVQHIDSAALTPKQPPAMQGTLATSPSHFNAGTPNMLYINFASIFYKSTFLLWVDSPNVIWFLAHTGDVNILAVAPPIDRFAYLPLSIPAAAQAAMRRSGTPSSFLVKTGRNPSVLANSKCDSSERCGMMYLCVCVDDCRLLESIWCLQLVMQGAVRKKITVLQIWAEREEAALGAHKMLFI